MLNDMLKNVNKIYIAYGYTDFRKNTASLCNMIQNVFGMNPYNKSAYIFCNKQRTSIKVLCYDKNGFILAQKTLLNADKMKFQWPRNTKELKQISKRQLEWLLSGLQMYPKKYFEEIEIKREKVAI